MTDQKEKETQIEFSALKLKPRLPLETAIKTLEKMMQLHSVSELSEDKVELYSGLICQERLFLEKDAMVFRLGKPIKNVDGETQRDFKLKEPSMKDLDDIGIELWDFGKQINFGNVDTEKANAWNAMCMGIPVDLFDQVKTGDVIPLFSVTTTFFLSQ